MGCGGTEGQSLPQRPPQASIEFHTDYSLAIQQAEEAGRPLMVLFTCRDCPCCRYMLQHALRDPKAVASAKDFLCVQVELEQNAQLCREFRVQSFPTLQFVSPDGVALRRVAGQLDGTEVATLLQNMRESAARRNLARDSRPARYTFGDRPGSLR